MMAGVLAVAACGGSDDAGAPEASNEATTSVTDSPATDPPATDPTTTDPTTTDPTTTSPPTNPPATDPPATDPPKTEAPVADPPVVITSEDGALAIEVSSADAARVDPSIRILDRSEWPPELAGSDEQSGVVIYELEPDGATFDEPVLVTRAFDVASFGEDVGVFDVPLVALVTQDGDGRFELLGDLTVTRAGDVLLVSGSTMHFSPIVTTSLGRSLEYVVEDPTVVGLINEGREITAEQVVNGLDNQLINAIPTFSARSPLPSSGEVRVWDAISSQSPPNVLRFEPTSSLPIALTPPGSATASFLSEVVAEVDGESSGIAGLIASLGIEQLPDDVRLKAALLIGAVDDDELEKRFEVLRIMAEEAGFTMKWIHTEFGRFPSFSRKSLEIAELPDGYAVASATVSGGLVGGSIVDAVVMDRLNGEYVGETGLASYGAVDETLVIGPEEDVAAFVDGEFGETWPPPRADAGFGLTGWDVADVDIRIEIGPDEDGVNYRTRAARSF